MLTIVLARSGKAIYFTCLVAWWSFWFFDPTPCFFWFGEATEPPFLGPCFIIFLEELSRTCTQVSMCVCVWFVQKLIKTTILYSVAKVGGSLNATAFSFNVSFDQPSVRFVSSTTTTEACICVYTSRWVQILPWTWISWITTFFTLFYRNMHPSLVFNIFDGWWLYLLLLCLFYRRIRTQCFIPTEPKKNYHHVKWS